MNGFQQDFFRLRQSEWQDYVEAYPPLTVKQVRRQMQQAQALGDAFRQARKYLHDPRL